MATDALGWNEDETRFPLEGRILFTQPNEGNSISNWKKAWTVKLAPVQAILAVLATEELPELSPKRELIFPSDTAPIKEASLVIIKKDKSSSKFSLVRVSKQTRDPKLPTIKNSFEILKNLQSLWCVELRASIRLEGQSSSVHGIRLAASTRGKC